MGRQLSEDIVEPRTDGDEAIRRLLVAGDKRAALAALMEQHGDTVHRFVELRRRLRPIVTCDDGPRSARGPLPRGAWITNWCGHPPFRLPVWKGG